MGDRELLKYMCAKIVIKDKVLTKLLQKYNGAVFWPHMVDRSRSPLKTNVRN